jgi:hypothetical protein
MNSGFHLLEDSQLQSLIGVNPSVAACLMGLVYIIFIETKKLNYMKSLMRPNEDLGYFLVDWGPTFGLQEINQDGCIWGRGGPDKGPPQKNTLMKSK